MKAYIKMEKIVKFGNIDHPKTNISPKEKNYFNKKNTDINKIVVSNKVSFGEKRI